MGLNPIILIVDDQEDARKMFGTFLERKGFKTILAANALEALRALKHHHVDLILTDYHMPQMTGMDLLREARVVSPQVPVIMMSGQADMKTAVETLREEAFDFLSKPVDSNDLLQTVTLCLRRFRSEPAGPVETGKDVGPVHCTQSDQHPVTILEFNRPLDEFSQKSFDVALRRLAADGEIQKAVIIVMRNVPYMNNVGMNFLLSTYKDWKSKGCAIAFTHLSEPVHKYLKLLGYLDFFPTFLNTKDALSFLGTRSGTAN